ncbi:hypothetical protein AB0A05_27375 [Streptomyces sp. NPDC046374]|uniref:hypothetical protein n=1 Tax=Streptomyces sp. NPDC046374 TaxID=3154917 RepID=UPI0033D5600F
MTTTLWNTLVITLSRADGFGSPQYGTGGWTREEALAEQQSLLDRLAAEFPHTYSSVAAKWRIGAKDDTVYARPRSDAMSVHAIYEYPEDEDPVHKALEWLDDFSMQATGQPFQLIVPPTTPPTAPGGTFSRR